MVRKAEEYNQNSNSTHAAITLDTPIPIEEFEKILKEHGLHRFESEVEYFKRLGYSMVPLQFVMSTFHHQKACQIRDLEKRAEYAFRNSKLEYNGRVNPFSEKVKMRLLYVIQTKYHNILQQLGLDK